MRGALATLARLESSLASAPPSPEGEAMYTPFSREVAIRRNVFGHVERLSRRVLVET